MAKESKKNKAAFVNVAVLSGIASAPNGIGRVTQAEGVPLIEAGLIQVDTSDVVEDKAAAKLTDSGQQYLNNLNGNINKEKPMYGIIKGVVIPPSQRGNRKGAGAPTVYPFATMDVGDSFFVPNSEKKDAAKKLGSTVSQFNMKNRVATDETETKEVTKRGKGNKAELNPDGSKVKETKTVPVYRQTKKFVLRAVKKDQQLGEWKAPEDGALIAREM